MSYKQELASHLSKKLGKDVDDVLDELFRLGALDETLARRGCVVHTYYERVVDTRINTTAIITRLAYEYHMGETTVYDMVHRY